LEQQLKNSHGVKEHQARALSLISARGDDELPPLSSLRWGVREEKKFPLRLRDALPDNTAFVLLHQQGSLRIQGQDLQM
ncbi:hypothetical protein ABG768_017662, partial [Culter alburnus]